MVAITMARASLGIPSDGFERDKPRNLSLALLLTFATGTASTMVSLYVLVDPEAGRPRFAKTLTRAARRVSEAS